MVFIATLIVFMVMFGALMIGVVFQKKITRCSNARVAGDQGEIACGSCAVLDKEDCNKNPYANPKTDKQKAGLA